MKWRMRNKIKNGIEKTEIEIRNKIQIGNKIKIQIKQENKK